jgi:hypothetical protein
MACQELQHTFEGFALLKAVCQLTQSSPLFHPPCFVVSANDASPRCAILLTDWLSSSFREEFEITQMVISKVALLRSNAPTVASLRFTGQRFTGQRSMLSALEVSRYLLTILHGALYKSSAHSGQM